MRQVLEKGAAAGSGFDGSSAGKLWIKKAALCSSRT
jgi:hypothetical protein